MKVTDMKEYLYNVLVFFGILLFSFFAGELIIRIISANKFIYNIEMVKYAKQLKIRDPEGIVSHIHKKNTSAKLMGVEIALNNLGNRGKDFTASSEANNRRILVMGSSITMGWGVPSDSVFTSITERKLNTEKPLGDDIFFEIVNAGIGNYNSFYQYRRFLTQYPIVKPDAVVLHYFINDAESNPRRNDNFFLKHSLLAAYFYDKINILKFSLDKSSNLVDYYGSLYRDYNQFWRDAQASILKIRDICKEDNVPFMIMIIPDFHNLSEDSPYKGHYRKIYEAFKNYDIPVINCFTLFQKQFGNNEKILGSDS